jgi:polysaccharide pyruvyl transferase WcaK-like protein
MPMHHPFDDNISKEVIRLLKCDHILLNNEYNVRELMGIISAAKLTIGMRLHALIYTAAIGLPLIGIVYDPKVLAFMDYVNQPFYVDVSDIDTVEMLKMADEIMKNYEKIKAEVEHEGERLKELSGKDAEIVLELL